MLTELNTARAFLLDKFGSLEAVKAGIYSVPTETSKGKAFMKVEITTEMGMSLFNLFKDEALTVPFDSNSIEGKFSNDQ